MRWLADHEARPPVLASSPRKTITCLFLCALCVGCDSRREPLVFGGDTMGTYYSVTVADVLDEAAVAHLRHAVEGVLADVNNRMSTYLEDSELSRFNHSRSTEWQPASAALVKVLLEARRVSELSGGAFDVTVGPVVNLWGFGPDPGVDDVPTANAIARALSRVGHRHLEVRESPPMIRKRLPRLYVDLSAIAKGYAVDEVVVVLAAEGVANALVDVGGELYALGVNARGEPWRVGIEKPVEGAREVLRSIEVSGVGVATSGDYRIYTEIEGRRYSHEIDPYSGWPVTHRTALVSVIAPSAMEADALVTALLILGSAAGLEFAHRHAVAAYFVDRDDDGFASFASPEFEARFASQRQPERSL